MSLVTTAKIISLCPTASWKFRKFLWVQRPLGNVKVQRSFDRQLIACRELTLTSLLLGMTGANDTRHGLRPEELLTFSGAVGCNVELLCSSVQRLFSIFDQDFFPSMISRRGGGDISQLLRDDVWVSLSQVLQSDYSGSRMPSAGPS